MTDYEITETLDAKGLSCPMPVVKTKQTIDTLAAGETVEVLATDAGSMSDLAGWADTTDGVELLNQTDEGDIYRHVVRKTA
ncbi:sulfurtransferase TusA family protein [Natronomonas sp.]|uniref:sulfurtransferase TusA family protein n=1 Tax=Natronomonas sp. TaxID=2184060 RepID=UPI00261F5ED6|nr:sulfurtransferase TusA family protein [Natronomonas sp.]